MDETRIRSIPLQIARSGDLTSVLVNVLVVRLIECWGVEYVEDVSAEIQLLFMKCSEALEDGCVDSLEAGTCNLVTAATHISVD